MRVTARVLPAVGVAAAAMAAFSVVIGGPSPIAAQVREARERALWVSVVDQQGAPVLGLRPDDFIVREDGRRREAIRVEKAAEPIDLTLLVDTSQAMTPHMQSARLAVKELVTTLIPHAAIALVTFGERPTIVVERTSTLASIARGVDRLFPVDGSGAYLLDAVVEVSNGLLKRQPARPIIAAVVAEGVEFTDLYSDLVLARLAETGARFDVFNLNEGASTELPDQPARERARVIAEGTLRSGGYRGELISNLALSQILARYAVELLNQYRVVYVRPESLIPPEKIEISVARPGLTVRGTPVVPPRG